VESLHGGDGGFCLTVEARQGASVPPGLGEVRADEVEDETVFGGETPPGAVKGAANYYRTADTQAFTRSGNSLSSAGA
jgi:hypothetical protein